MILAIRISGLVEIPEAARETLDRMRLKRKYSATLFHDTPENRKLILKVRNFIAYGPVDDAALATLLVARGQTPSGEPIKNPDVLIKELHKKDITTIEMKPFFRLHPPRKGIESKKHFGIGKGVLGDNGKEIVKLMERML